MFSQACVKNSVHKGGSAPVHAGIHTPWADTPWQTPPRQTPPGQTPPWADSHPWSDALPRRPTQLTVRILLECFLVHNIFDLELIVRNGVSIACPLSRPPFNLISFNFVQFFWEKLTKDEKVGARIFCVGIPIRMGSGKSWIRHRF